MKSPGHCPGPCGAGAAYFRTGNSARQFRAIDSYVHERMAIFTSAKHKRSGRNWGARYNYAWYRRLGVHRLSGTSPGTRRMPDGERCRKAVCGRTACTV